MCVDCDIKGRMESRRIVSLNDDTPLMTPDERTINDMAHAEREFKKCRMCNKLTRTAYCSDECAERARDYSR